MIGSFSRCDIDMEILDITDDTKGYFTRSRCKYETLTRVFDFYTATSKLKYLDDMDTTTGSFGFRGESLVSISDVSVLEILTKAHGMPNGFRKILKGCKCLCLGIYDDRQDIGTTVIVRDLFYNQPVRRNQMQSSPKKALDSVRKCVLHIALVHSKVLFKVVDIESEDKLLYTQPSSSPLPLLTACFGIETSSTLHELKLSDGVLELSGYVSSPFNIVAVKALQCFYINSRHVCASPVHKLLNQLATRFNCIGLLKENSLNTNGKRSRSQAYPNYILNIRCPRSRYDLSFEPSKTSVEFKNWVPVLAFLERVITQFWSEKRAEGSTTSNAPAISNNDKIWEDNVLDPSQDMLPESKIPKKTHNMTRPPSSEEILAQDGRHLNNKRRRRVTFQKFHNSADFSKEQVETIFAHDVDHFMSWNFSPEKCTSSGNLEAGNIQWTPDNNIFSDEGDFLDDNQRATQRFDDSAEDCSFDSKWKENFRKVNYTMNRGLISALSYKCSDFTNDAEDISNRFEQPFLKSCSSRGRLPSNETSFAEKEVFERQDRNFSTKLKHYEPDGIVDAVRFESTDPTVAISQGSLWKDAASNARPSPKFGSSSCMRIDDRDFSSSESLKSFSFDKDCFIAGNISNGIKQPFFMSCSSRELLPSNETIFAEEEVFERQDRNFSTKLKHYEPDDIVDSVQFEGTEPTVGISQGTLWKDVALNARPSPKFGSTSYVRIEDRDFSSSEYLKSLSFDKNCFIEHYAFPPKVTRDTTDFGTDGQFFKSQWHPLPSDFLLENTSWELDHFLHENQLQRDFRFRTNASTGDFLDKGLTYDPILSDFSKEHLLYPNSISYGSDFNSCSGRMRDVRKLPRGYIPDDITSARCSLLTEEADWFCVNPLKKDFPVPSHLMSTYSRAKDDIPKKMVRNQICEQNVHHKRKFGRSQSAPPIHKSKRIFGVKSNFSVGSEKLKSLEASTCLGPIMYSKPPPDKDSYNKPSPHHPHGFREDLRKIPHAVLDDKEVLNRVKSQHSVKCKEVSIEEDTDSRIKWRIDRHHVADWDNSNNVQNQWNILDISSGILHFASDSLVPDINKKCLENTKVLQQVDNKYIPVVASGTLVIIDQHAADERIRLEELRHKVLSGEEKTVTYLDTEQELVLPEIGYQLLQNYSEQIQNWGWICNIHAHGLKSFAKNMDLLQRRPAVVTLLAVPCILGVNLSDIDLLEFLQQLADTDGSSRIPSSVLRILNSKACRGAIMFGDSLLPSECSLIVEELKQTSLCFQCAHGRPTTVPLVNLETLHREITKLGVRNDESNELWHGLSRHSISLERATQRLNSATC